jgi:hypothetical protein
VKKFLFFVITVLTCRAYSYPDFISYGYNNCLNCHVNAAGGGPLSDYGRALWAAEIAAKPFWTKASDEKLAAQSGFFGKRKRPLWLKPYAKYRGLWYKTGVGQSPSGSENRYIQMQADAGATIYFDKKQNWTFTGAIGYVPTPQGASGAYPEEVKNFISREYYLRKKIGKTSWIYAGFMDKVYGLRIADHTAYSRLLSGAAQNDQSHSLVWHKQGEKSNLFVQLSAGHLEQRSEVREPGAGIFYERELANSWMGGVSGFVTRNSFVQKNRVALFSRLGLPYHNSFLTELGWVDVAPKALESSQAVYFLGRGIIQIRRGYNFLSQAEFMKENVQSADPKKFKMSFGVLMFPFQRAELDMRYVVGRQINVENGEDDSKSLLLQLHISL